MAYKGDIEGIKIISMGVTLSEETILTFALCGNINAVDELLKLKTQEKIYLIYLKII